MSLWDFFRKRGENYLEIAIGYLDKSYTFVVVGSKVIDVAIKEAVIFNTKNVHVVAKRAAKCTHYAYKNAEGNWSLLLMADPPNLAYGDSVQILKGGFFLKLIDMVSEVITEKED